MRNWVRPALGSAELIAGAVVHVGYAFYVFGTAVATVVSASLVNSIMFSSPRPCFNGSVPPIVLVHGIFGFGKGVRVACLSAARLLCSKRWRQLGGLAEDARAMRNI
ncbi:unnamed protein product [Urochloa humidicola]